MRSMVDDGMIYVYIEISMMSLKKAKCFSYLSNHMEYMFTSLTLHCTKYNKVVYVEVDCKNSLPWVFSFSLLLHICNGKYMA